MLAEVLHGLAADNAEGPRTCKKADVHAQAAGAGGISCIVWRCKHLIGTELVKHKQMVGQNAHHRPPPLPPHLQLQCHLQIYSASCGVCLCLLPVRNRASGLELSYST